MSLSESSHNHGPLAVQDYGFFLLRTSSLPADEFLRWSGELQLSKITPNARPEEIEIAWDEDRRVLRERLRRLIERPDISQALFIASPSLHAGIEYWRSDPLSKKGLQAERALVRYFTRMCTRATPFGLFSGCTLGEITTPSTGKSVLRLQAQEQYRPKTRLDFDYLTALTHALTLDHVLREQLRFEINSSIHHKWDGWHYIETRHDPDAPFRRNHLVRIDSSPFVDAVIAKASEGTTGFAELVETLLKLSDDPALSYENARAFVHELVDNGVLLSTLSPRVTGEPPLEDIVSQLRDAPSGQKAAEVLSSVQCRLRAIDDRGIGVELKEYQDILTSLETLPAKVDPWRIFQVDLIKPAEKAILGPAISRALIEAFEVLCRFHVATESQHLIEFRKAFLQRYEYAVVPLLDVVDEDSGIGFGAAGAYESTAICGLHLKAEKGERRKRHLSDAQAFLLDRLISRGGDCRDELHLQLADLPDFEEAADNVPSSSSLWAELVAESPEALAREDFQILVNGTFGPGGARPLGRFCHPEPKLTPLVRKYLECEQIHEPDAILAEIVHLPEGRAGNVVCRPVLRDYEITYLGRSGIANQQQIAASDLLVGLDSDNRLYLHSRRLNKRVIPRLTTAHGFFIASMSPVYRFLGALQHQGGVAGPAFSWGPLEEMSYLPRVRVGRVILSVARWRLRRREIESLAKYQGVRRYLAVRELRTTRCLPRFIELEEHDQTLMVDLENALSVDALVHVLRRADNAVLREVFPSPDQLCVSSKSGRFWHELYVPLSCRKTTTRKRYHASATVNIVSRASQNNACLTSRSLLPGSEWLFFKIYGGNASLDQILRSQIRLAVRAAAANGWITKWFFIRYADPDQHLRVRFHGNPRILLHDLLPAMQAMLGPLLDSGAVWRLQIDTYVREVERYGGRDGVLYSEEIFHADSEAVIDLLNLFDLTEELDTRWRLALLGSDALLFDSGFDEGEQRVFLRELRESSDERFRIDSEDRQKLGSQFRREREWIENLEEGKGSGAWDIASKTLQNRSRVIRSAFERLRSLATSGELGVSLPALVRSYLHMHINRMMRTAALEHELAIYDLLHRLHEGRFGKMRSVRETGSVRS